MELGGWFKYLFFKRISVVFMTDKRSSTVDNFACKLHCSWLRKVNYNFDLTGNWVLKNVTDARTLSNLSPASIFYPT